MKHVGYYNAREFMETNVVRLYNNVNEHQELGSETGKLKEI